MDGGCEILQDLGFEHVLPFYERVGQQSQEKCRTSPVLAQWDITPRVFLRDFLEVDAVWKGDPSDDAVPSGLHKELIRCDAKRLLTVMQDSRSPKLWDNEFRQNE